MDNLELQKIDKPKDIKDQARREAFATWAVSLHRKLHQNRQSQIDLAMDIQKWRSLNQSVPSVERNEGEPTNGYKDGKFASIALVKKARVANQSWSNVGQMFFVDSTEPNNSENAKAQQEYITQSLTKMKAGKQFEKAYYDGFQVWGEYISWVGWKQRSIQKPVYGNKFVSINYDNADIKAINPMFFEFDTSKYDPDNLDTFKSLIKIAKRFETVETILNSKYVDPTTSKQLNIYSLTKEQIGNIKNSETNDTSVEDKKDDKELATDNSNGTAHEVLYLHGDFKFDGVDYKNYIAEVYAGQYLIRFEPNPIIINPFIMKIPEVNPGIGRGIAELAYFFDACKLRQENINQKMRIDALIANPPTTMTEEMRDMLFKGKNQMTWKPGMITTVSALTQDFNAIKKEQFTNQGTIENISFISNEISDNSATNANSMGNVETQKRLATDLQLAQAGSDVRLQQVLDGIYEFAIDNVEAVGNILAIFKTGEEILRVKDKNEEKQLIINNIIRQGNYDYTYEDRNAIDDRKQKYNNLVAMVEKLAQDPEYRQYLEMYEIVKTGFEMNGYDNAEKFLKQPGALQQLASQLSQLPPEQQQQIAQMVMSMLQQGQQPVPTQ